MHHAFFFLGHLGWCHTTAGRGSRRQSFWSENSAVKMDPTDGVWLFVMVINGDFRGVFMVINGDEW